MENNNTNNKTSITRKEWRRNKRRASYLRKKEAKKAIEIKRSAEQKRYDLLAQYQEPLSTQVRAIIESNKIKYSILANTYFVISNIPSSTCKEIESAFEKCTISRGEHHRPLKVTFAKWKSKSIIVETKESKNPSNNTTEAKSAAKAKRKAKNVAKCPKFVKHVNDNKKPTKENPVPQCGRNKKKLTYRYCKHRFKALNKVVPALKETNLEKKLRQRAQKAGRYIIKQEKKASVIHTKAPKPRKPVQQKFNFAA
jgi:hypothetical protein